MLLSEGINRVRAYALPCGVSGDGMANQLTGACVVKWHSSYKDLFHQVYVNGKFAGATVDTNQRQMIVPVPLSQQAAVRIEVFAVEAENADKDFSFDIGVKIGFARTDNLPIDGRAEICNETIEIFPGRQGKGGFGMNVFGGGDFGYDGCGAIGFGKGNFGWGWFGFDNDVLVWMSGQLEKGNYKFDIQITDNNGNNIMTETEAITVIPKAKPANELKIKSFDKQNNKLTLEIL